MQDCAYASGKRSKFKLKYEKIWKKQKINKKFNASIKSSL
jgi:predicted transglutaminase-like cysteine proteinase